ncbi:MAG: ATP-dependent sacrificial sulfur transferase LarE [Bryobacteraceae bacterium]|nr:ATP-dependent sacrificial sulfur transferase LarE [Bryobacteraceae bacterium]
MDRNRYNGRMTGLVTLGAPALDSAALQEKQERLIGALRAMGHVLVAYSGGTDSAYLAWAAKQALGDNAVAVTADSPSVPRSHMRDAVALTRDFGIRHEIIETREFENPEYAANNPDRCFYCKDELFRRMEALADRFPGQTIVYGVNKDDLGDFRPGQKAAKIHAVKAPLVEAGLTKAEIRELSRLAGLPTWDRPAAACLSSRVAYGTQVTVENIQKVELAEEALKEIGFLQFRVRYHSEELVRVEIAREEMPKALSLEVFDEISRRLKKLGFKYVTLDLQGYRQGSMNEVLSESSKAKLQLQNEV